MSSGNSPFKFLDPFTKEDKEIFFGRDAEIEQLYEMVFESNLLLVYGESGTGKTSLVQCGLSSRFSDTDWLSILVRRGNRNINEVLMEELNKVARKPIPPETPVPKAVESVYLDHFRPIYLVFDQFEELFVADLGSTPTERNQFSRSIADLLAANQECTVIFVMREEYLAKLYEFESGNLPRIFNKRIRIERMSPSNVEQVITKTCARYNIELEEPEQTVHKIIAKISGEQAGIHLAYLQVYLDKLYQKATEAS
ncbi:MAG: ATP-binding protein [Lewinellaceae bacterium]|nr:ATP-binding protein [Lewinellaceae bacterium]